MRASPPQRRTAPARRRHGVGEVPSPCYPRKPSGFAAFRGIGISSTRSGLSVSHRTTPVRRETRDTSSRVRVALGPQCRVCTFYMVILSLSRVLCSRRCSIRSPPPRAAAEGEARASARRLEVQSMVQSPVRSRAPGAARRRPIEQRYIELALHRRGTRGLSRYFFSDRPRPADAAPRGRTSIASRPARRAPARSPGSCGAERQTADRTRATASARRETEPRDQRERSPPQ
jgi:hypothetical protein